MTTYSSRSAVSQPAYGPIIPSGGAPAGTFAPGTKVQVGSHRVVVEKYLSEGGFAHVYVVKLPTPEHGTAVLKRVAVPDKDALTNMRNEVETMKRLRGHKYIVTYIDSHASQLKGGGYEVFLLMEYCAGGGLIDFMNTRLKNRLTEPEILDIFGDAAEGVASMHYLKPPLLHRDLKVENILISKTSDGRRRYKLCDFGSAAPPRPAAKSASEGSLIEEDVQRNTTLQYRSPEMIDVYRHKPIDEKSDVWALGVLLYKLCYYTTPFEEQGQMAILRASFKFPAYPQYSDRLKKLIAIMLMEDPNNRPNTYQIVKEASAMRGKDCPIRDIYSNRTRSEVRDTQQLPSREPNVKSPPMVGAKIEAPEQKNEYIPEVIPMRRGRPTAPSQQNKSSRPSPSPNKQAGADPFAALDSKNYDERAQAVDELSQKYPSLDEFSLIQDKNSTFEFQSNSTKPPAKPPRPLDINQQVTKVLADEAFARPSAPQPKSTAKTQSAPPAKPLASTKPIKDSPIVRSSPPERLAQPQPEKPAMVSTGTMTSDPPAAKRSAPVQPPKSNFEVWHVPQRDSSPRLSSLARFDSLATKRSPLRDFTKSPQPELPTSPASSRPSLEGGRPTSMDLTGSDIYRSRSTNAAPEEKHRRRGSGLFRRGSSHKEAKRRSALLSSEPAKMSSSAVDDDSNPNISSDIDYLRAVEAENEATHKSQHRRSSSAIKQMKHSSLPSISGSVKNKFAGKFSDTFKRFENNRNSSPRIEPLIDAPPSTNIPLASQATSDEDDDPTIRAPTAPTAKSSDPLDDRIDETQDVPPEVRRELERRQLEAEERRVEEAAAAYRARVANGQTTGGGPEKLPSRATAIQDRVRTLLDESERGGPVKKTAEGYGRYTTDAASSNRLEKASGQDNNRRQNPPPRASESLPNSTPRSTSAPQKPANIQKPLPPKPSIAPKPVALRTGGSNTARPSVDTARPTVKPPTPNLMDSSPDMPRPSLQGGTPNLMDESPDWEATFAKRYPRMSLELVEAEIGPVEEGRSGRVREV